MTSAFPELFSPEQSPRTIAILVAVVFIAHAFIRGIARQVLGMACLACGFAAGWLVFRHAPEFLSRWFQHLHPDWMIALSVAAGAVVHHLARRLLCGLVKPEMGVPVTGGDRVRSGIFSLIPAAFLLWVAAMGVRWTGALARMQYIDDGIRSEGVSLQQKSPLFARAQLVLTTGTVGGWLDRTDPLSSTEASALCSLLLIRRDEDAWPRLLHDPAAGPILRHPTLQRLVRDHDWLRPASFRNYARLLTLPEVTAALKDPALTAKLRALDVESSARHAIGLTPAVARRRGSKPMPADFAPDILIRQNRGT